MTVIGIDAGASHVAAGLAAGGAEAIVRRAVSPVPSVLADPAALARTIADLCAELIATSGHPPSHLVAGVAGAGDDRVRGDFERLLADLLPQIVVAATTDIEIALEGGFPDGPGIVVAAGTGSFAALRTDGGQVVRVGGWGSVIGDRGSAYDLARAALQHCAWSHDRGSAPARFVAAVTAAAGLASAADLARWSTTAPRHRIAALSVTVSALAAEGDEVAVALVDRAATHLVDLVHVLVERTATVGAPVALTGGLLCRESPVRPALIALLAAERCAVTDIEVDGVLGAVRLANRRATAV